MKGPTSEEQRLVLFENKWLEKLTVVSVRWFIATWTLVLPLIAWMGWGAVSAMSGIGLVVAGWLVWSLFEYVAHRKLFHWDPEWLPLKQFVFVIHGNHHIQPRDELRNLMPPTASIPVGVAIWAMFWLAFGDPGTWITFGFVCGYVSYDLTHYACHHWNMKGSLGKRLKRHHMQHHFIADHRNFGVTTVFWDQIFGTRLQAKRRGEEEDFVEGEVLHPAE